MKKFILILAITINTSSFAGINITMTEQNICSKFGCTINVNHINSRL